MSIKKIGIYGSGKVALSLGYELRAKGFEISYFARSIDKIEVKESILSIGAVIVNSVNELIEWADATGFIIADDAIKDFASNLKPNPQKYVFHSSGALSSEILGEGWKKVFSFHPLRAFAGVEKSLEGTVFAVEMPLASADNCDAEARKDILEFANNFRFISINTEQKILYHASAVIASNLIVPLIDLANEQLRRTGIDDESLLWPLIDSAVANMKKMKVKNALTGPIARGDYGTIKAHLESLSPADSKIYCVLSDRALDFSKASPKEKEEIRRLLMAK